MTAEADIGDQAAGLTHNDVAAMVSKAFHDGYAAGVAAPRGIKDPCPGSGRTPGRITRYHEDAMYKGRPYRGLCSFCGREYTLAIASGTPKVGKHRRHTK